MYHPQSLIIGGNAWALKACTTQKHERYSPLPYILYGARFSMVERNQNLML